MSGGIISLDTQAIESQQIKLANHTKFFHAGFLRVLKALQNQIKEEKRLYIATGSIRSKRKVILARRQDIIDKLFYEVDTMSMNIQEAQTLQNDYESMRYYYTKCLTNVIQYTEQRIAVQKEKTLLRMTGFAKNVIDDIKEDARLPRSNKNHHILYIIQVCKMKLISDSILPHIEQINMLFQYLNSAEHIDSIVLFNALQLLDILASQNWPKSKNLQKDEERQIVHRLMHIIPYGFTYIRTWDLGNYKHIALFIVQLFQTLKSVLCILQVYGSISEEVLYGTSSNSSTTTMNSNANIGSSSYKNTGMGHYTTGTGSSTVDNSLDVGSSYNQNTSTASTTHTGTTHTTSKEHQQDSTYYFHWSDTDHTDTTLPPNSYNNSSSTSHSPSRIYRDYNLTMDIILWLKTFKYVKLGYFDSGQDEDEVSLLDEFCTPDLYDIQEVNETTSSSADNTTAIPTTTSSNNSSRVRVCIRAYVIRELRTYAVLGSALMTNTLLCAEAMAHVLIHTYHSHRRNASSGVDNNASNSKNVNKSTKVNTSTNNTSTLYNMPITPLIPSIPIYGSLIHSLLLYSIDLGKLNLNKYAYKLNTPGSSSGISYSNHQFLKAADLEVVSILKCCILLLSNGILEESSFTIIEAMTNIVIHRYNNYFLINNYIYTLLSLILLLIEKERIVENIFYNHKKEIIQHYISSTNKNKNTTTTNDNNSIKTKSDLYSTSFKPNKASRLIPKKPNLLTSVHNIYLLYPFLTNLIKTNKEIIQYIKKNVLLIMAIIVSYKNHVSMIHPSLLLMRLLYRDLFLPRIRIEEILEIPVLSLLLPMVDITTALNYYTQKEQQYTNKNPEKERILDDKSIQDMTVRTLDTSNTIDIEYSVSSHTSINNIPNTATSTNNMNGRLLPVSPNASIVCEDSSIVTGSLIESSPPQSPSMPTAAAMDSEEGGTAHNDSFFSIDNTSTTTAYTTPTTSMNQNTSSTSSNLTSIPLAEDYWKAWITNNLEKEVTAGEGYSAPKLNFIQYLQYIGETHIQCKEVMEQYLLLLDHLINKSQVCKFQLIDNNITIVMNRIKSCYINNVYMIALVEICSEQLELKI